MKKQKNMKLEQLNSGDIISSPFDQRRLFGSRQTINQTINQESLALANNLVADLNRKIALSPHRYS